MNVDVKIDGVEEILKKLHKLPEKIQKNVVRGAVRAGAKPMLQEAKALVPVQHGTLRQSLAITKVKTRKKTLVWYQISPASRKLKKGDFDGWYGHMVEFGTYAKRTKPLSPETIKRLNSDPKRKERRDKIVAKGGGAAPHPFLRPALERKGGESIEAAKEYMRKRIDKELAKL